MKNMGQKSDASADKASSGKAAASGVLPFALSALLLLFFGYAATWGLGAQLAPPPGEVLAALWRLLASGALMPEVATTVWRAVLGLILALGLGTLLGCLAGLSPVCLRLVAPLIAALQTCPPVVWITLAMVWAGTGGVVPVAVVFAAVLPLAFVASAQGMLGVSERLKAMSRLYDVPWPTRLERLFLPALSPYWLAGFSTSLATAWKSAAVAEFLGSHSGVGARIYWCYRRMAMEELFAWAMALILLGVVLECGLVGPLRKKTARLAAGRTDAPRLP